MLPPDSWRSVFGTLAHNRGFSVKDVREYASFSHGMGIERLPVSTQSLLRSMVREGLLQKTTPGHYYPTERGWKWIEHGEAVPVIAPGTRSA